MKKPCDRCGELSMHAADEDNGGLCLSCEEEIEENKAQKIKLKIRPICPACKTVGNMAGNSDQSVIFCATCGHRTNKTDLNKFMAELKSR